ncbi:MAG: hypothetical protein HFE80_10740 [Clostridiaceae bacterium]|nr:hypothetical protein [Clostridiaceae bacterium]
MIGKSTAAPKKERIPINEFLENAKSHEILREGEKTFILVHAGINHFHEDKPLKDYEFIDFIILHKKCRGQRKLYRHFSLKIFEYFVTFSP